MRIVIALFLCLILSANAFAVEKTVKITPAKGPIQQLMQAPAGVCVFGNQNPVSWSIPNWVVGGESYATVFEAVQPPCGCPEGFNVEMVHIYFEVDAEDVPITFDAVATFRETVINPTTGCEVPGAVICSSPTYTVTLEAAGGYDIGLPIDAASCGCAYFGYKYAVAVEFPNALSSQADLFTDDTVVGCQSFNDYGNGWEDLAGHGWPGEMIMFADIVCCAPAVPAEDKSWGDVKSLYR